MVPIYPVWVLVLHAQQKEIAVSSAPILVRVSTPDAPLRPFIVVVMVVVIITDANVLHKSIVVLSAPVLRTGALGDITIMSGPTTTTTSVIHQPLALPPVPSTPLLA
jgi:hypothetical protein